MENKDKLNKKVDPTKYDANTKLDWWAYLHEDGSIKVKRYLSPADITEARESPFVVEIMEPFKAKGMDDAIAQAQKHLRTPF